MSNYLMHHGVKGQRRGHRRYQNEDGSYTQEGREHYGIGDGSRRSSNFVSEKSFTSNPSERRREELSRIVKTKDKSSKPEENSKGKVAGKKDAKSKDEKTFNKMKKKELREHAGKVISGLTGVGLSAVSQALISKAYAKNPQFKNFYRVMTAVNVTSAAFNAASAHHHAKEHHNIKRLKYNKE